MAVVRIKALDEAGVEVLEKFDEGAKQ